MTEIMSNYCFYLSISKLFKLNCYKLIIYLAINIADMNLLCLLHFRQRKILIPPNYIDICYLSKIYYTFRYYDYPHTLDCIFHDNSIDLKSSRSKIHQIFDQFWNSGYFRLWSLLTHQSNFIDPLGLGGRYQNIYFLCFIKSLIFLGFHLD